MQIFLAQVPMSQEILWRIGSSIKYNEDIEANSAQLKSEVNNLNKINNQDLQVITLNL
jgi:hypothetical protein